MSSRKIMKRVWAVVCLLVLFSMILFSFQYGF